MTRSRILKVKDNSARCNLVVAGPELAELKRHAHEIPECPGLDRRIQRYNGNGPLMLSPDELDWVVAVLDAALHDPKGYPCVDYQPWKLEYVATTDERCMTCQDLYDRLNQESARPDRHMKKKQVTATSRQRARDRQTAKSDLPKSKIEAVFRKRRCPAVVQRIKRGYTLFYDDRAVSRIRERGRWWEVLWWSHRDKWESIGDLGGVVFDRIEQAAGYVLDDPMGVFWH